MALTREFYELFLEDLKEELKTQLKMHLKTQKVTEILHVYISPIQNGDGCLGHVVINFQRANYTYYGASFYLMDDGQIWPSSNLTGNHVFLHTILSPCLHRWGEYVRNRFYAADRAKDFWEDAKEELVAAAWHPDRVAKWLEAEVDIEAM